jgi:hypothetical protein
MLSHITANASAYERNDNTTRHPHIYQNDNHAQRSFPEPAFIDEPRFLKLLQIIDQQQPVRTIKADCNRQSQFMPSLLQS